MNTARGARARDDVKDFFYYSFILFFLYQSEPFAAFTFQFLTFSKPRESIFSLSIFLHMGLIFIISFIDLCSIAVSCVTTYKISDLGFQMHKNEKRSLDQCL